MAEIITMPKLGLTMKEGVVAKWVKAEGETVEAGDILLEITTDKLTNSIEAGSAGVLKKIIVSEGEKVPCQSPLCVIGQEDEDIAACLAEIEESQHE